MASSLSRHKDASRGTFNASSASGINHNALLATCEMAGSWWMLMPEPGMLKLQYFVSKTPPATCKASCK